MAKGRLIDKKISLSEKVASLDILGQLLYTWMIVHSDDFGLLQGSARTIKALVLPMTDCSNSDVEDQLDRMINIGLLDLLHISSKQYYRIIGSEINQSLRRDRQPQTILDVKFSDVINENWKLCEKLISEARQSNDSQMPVNDSQMTGVDMLKRREEKRREVNTIGKTPEIKNGPLSGLLSKKSKEFGLDKRNGISTSWQEKAFRHAEELGINLKEEDKGRFLKIYKDESKGKNLGYSTDSTYSYLKDHSIYSGLPYEEKLKYFFWIINNGIKGFGF